MEDKITPARIGAYAARLARQVVTTSLGAAGTVEGPALLSLTPVRQLNLLVLHRLMHQWKLETERLRSPYFNYEPAEVQQALTALMSTLSRNILVRAADLEPLVAEAAADVLGLAFDPAATYARRFLPESSTAETFTATALRTELKYVDVNKPLLEDFLNSLPAAPLDRATVLNRLKLYATAHFRELAPAEPLLAQLSELVPVALADLRETGAAKPVAPVPVAPPTAPAPVASPTPTVAVPAPAPPAAAPAVPPTLTVPPVAKPVDLPPPATVRAPASGEAPLHQKLRADNEKVTLNDQLRGKADEKVSLNDQLRDKVSHAPALAEVLEAKVKIESIGKAISMNHKFAYIAELFDGDRAAFEAAVQNLDTHPTAEQAHAYLTGALAATHDWSGKAELVQRLARLIDRKFA